MKNIKGNSTSSALFTIIILLLVAYGVYYWTKHTASTTVVNNYTTTMPTPASTTTPGVPVASTGVASFTSQSGAVLNGEVNPNGVQTSYWYEYGLTQSLGGLTSPQLLGAGYATYKAPGALTGLKPSTLYYYHLVAENQYGKVIGDTSSFTTTSTTTSPAPLVNYFPPVVQTKDASSVSTATVTLNGIVNPSGSATFYWFEYGENFGLGNTSKVSSAGTGSVNVTASASLDRLTPNKTYYYRLNAQNAYGTANGNISIFITQPTNPPAPAPNAPNSVTGSASSITNSSAILNGQVDPNGLATTYHFEYGKSTPFGVFNLDHNTTNSATGTGTELVAVSKTVAVLDKNSTYYYRLVAENTQGKTFGAIFSFTTKK